MTTLQGRTTHSATLEVDVYSANGTMVQDVTVSSDSAGNFTLTGLTAGTYTVAVKTTGYLRTAQQVTLATDGSPVNIGQLRGGDANGDNAVNILDLSILSGSYNQSVGSPSYNPAADFNGDGMVNILDLSILSGNYNQVGD